MRRWIPVAGVVWAMLTLAVVGAPASSQAAAVPPAHSATGDIVAQITELLHAGTAPGIILGFIQQWPRPYLTSIDDLAALRKAGATDQILTAFSRRGAELRLRALLEKQRASAAAAGTNAPTVIFYPVVQHAPNWLAPVSDDQAPLYPFSDALWWWANFYPYPFDPYPVWGPIGSDHRHR